MDVWGVIKFRKKTREGFSLDCDLADGFFFFGGLNVDYEHCLFLPLPIICELIKTIYFFKKKNSIMLLDIFIYLLFHFGLVDGDAIFFNVLQNTVLTGLSF